MYTKTYVFLNVYNTNNSYYWEVLCHILLISEIIYSCLYGRDDEILKPDDTLEQTAAENKKQPESNTPLFAGHSVELYSQSRDPVQTSRKEQHTSPDGDALQSLSTELNEQETGKLKFCGCRKK